MSLSDRRTASPRGTHSVAEGARALALNGVFALSICVKIALAIALIGQLGQGIGEWLIGEALGCYEAPWLMLTLVFAAIGLGLEPQQGLAGAVLGHVFLAMIILAGFILVRAAPLCEQTAQWALTRPAWAIGVSLTFVIGLTLYLSFRKDS